jgi:cell fate regulator YaaT (PSP1 superfamily)
MHSDNLKKIIGVAFRKDGRVYDFYTGNFVLNEGDKVIVETEKGIDMGTVSGKARLRDTSMHNRPIKTIYRLATQEDKKQKEDNETIESNVMQFCKEQIKARNIPMHLVTTELSFDKRRLLLYYISHVRVDFRELAKDLIKKFHAHVEMKQIGDRDLSKMSGGVGHCGRQLCCSLFLSEFAPITIKMAKEQNISLNPSKISGVCGRLMCCLSFEYDSYKKRDKKSR